ncbi:MAG: hydroxyisourate hydrolase [Granulosicoccus sp.]|nr:hydroxyisourate hydrolase [Granulosicoccus sp.]
MSQITSHVLDTSLGKPAEGVLITLMQQREDDWLMLGSVATDGDGRVADFTGTEDVLPAGIYKLTFYLSDYCAASSQPCFYPQVDVVFVIEGDGQHYHVPLLVNPFGYSTYRGS